MDGNNKVDWMEVRNLTLLTDNVTLAQQTVGAKDMSMCEGKAIRLINSEFSYYA